VKKHQVIQVGAFQTNWLLFFHFQKAAPGQFSAAIRTYRWIDDRKYDEIVILATLGIAITFQHGLRPTPARAG